MKPSAQNMVTAPALFGLLLLAACGGGGTGGSPPLAGISSAPPPSAPSTPSGNPVTFDTAEYRRSAAAVDSGAIHAWTAGADGRGVTVAVIDSGIAQESAEFAGRIAAASRDVTGNARGIADSDGHGTSVSAVLAAARNDAAIVGLAPGATLAVMKADTPGSCAGDGCRFTDSAIAAGIDAAVAAGARAINISLGGGSGGQLLRNAVARATAAGVILVVSGGNDGQANPDPLALAILSSGNRANILIAGGHDENGQLASFANQAGIAMQNSVSALASRVRSIDELGGQWLYSGTSYATPQISAAVALLAQAFPHLSGSQIVELILSTARDAGAPGTDAVHGRGLLDIGRAFSPNGTTRLAGSAATLSLSANGNLGPAMGNGESFANALSAVPVVDGYARSYTIALGHSIRPSGTARLAAALHGQGLFTEQLDGGSGTWRTRLAISSATAPGQLAQGQAASQSHLGLAHRGMDAHAGSARLIRETRFTLETDGMRFGVATGPAASALLPGAAAPGLIAPDGLEPDHDPARHRRLVAMTGVALGRWHLAGAAATAHAPLAHTAGLARESRQQRAMLAVAGPLGPAHIALRLTHVDEQGSFLGTRLSPAFGLDGADTLFMGAALSVPLRHDTLFRMAGTHGQHRPVLGAGLLAASGPIRSAGWSLMLEQRTPLGAISLRHAQPLAITAGHLLLRTEQTRHAPLAATAREQASELGWRGALPLVGVVDLTAFHRQNPGHRPGPSDQGLALSLHRQF